jgi:hypothetical protein
MLGGSAGIWLFYLQHQFEDAYWQTPTDWGYTDAALRGSSYPKLPKLLQLFTGNIGLHPPRPPPQRPHSQLQPSARARREPDLPRGAEAIALQCPPDRQAQAMRREHRKQVTVAQAHAGLPPSTATPRPPRTRLGSPTSRRPGQGRLTRCSWATAASGSDTTAVRSVSLGGRPELL